LNAQTITSKAKSAIGETVDKLSGMMGLGAKPKRGRRRKTSAASAKTRARRAVSRSKTVARRKTAQVKRKVKSVAKKAALRTRKAIGRR